MKMNKKLTSLENTIKIIDMELRKLEGFRITKQLRQFKRQLIGERSYVKRQLAKFAESEKRKQQQRTEKRKRANEQRREKMERSWRYFSTIRKNYGPKKGGKEMSTKEIRSEFTKRRKGLQSDIDDIIWRNPSP